MPGTCLHVTENNYATHNPLLKRLIGGEHSYLGNDNTHTECDLNRKDSAKGGQRSFSWEQ